MIADVVLLLCLLQTGWTMKLSAQQAMMGRNVNIPCSFTVKSPPLDRRYLLITWYFQGKEILSVRNTAVTSTDPRMSYTSRAENGIADLSISEITITDGGIYRCSTEYRSEKEEKEIRLDVQGMGRKSLQILWKKGAKNKQLRIQYEEYFPESRSFEEQRISISSTSMLWRSMDSPYCSSSDEELSLGKTACD